MGAAGGKAAAVPQQGMGMAQGMGQQGFGAVQGVGQQGFGAVQGVGNAGMGAAGGVGNAGMGAVGGVGNAGMGAVNGVGNAGMQGLGGLPVVGGLAQGMNPFMSPEQAEVQAAKTVAVAPADRMPLNRSAALQANAEALKYKAPKMRTFGPSAQGSFAGFGGHYSGYPYGAYSQGSGYAPTYTQATAGTVGAGIAPNMTPSYGSQAAFGTVTAAPQTFTNWNAPTAYGAPAGFPGTVSSSTVTGRTVSGQAGITSLGAPPVGYE